MIKCGNNLRTKKIYINSFATLLGQLLQVIIGFFVRKLFLNYIGVEFLGYNSVFLNILQLLNLADMGIGVAVTSFLYKPLANQNRKEIAALMVIYKRLYSVMGIIVLSIGFLVIPFLPALIPDAKCEFDFLVLIYLINLAGTVSTYFLAYKRTLIIADQRSYITNIVDTSLFFGISVLQIIGMLLFPSYVIYITLNLIRNISSNIILSGQANRMYGHIYEDADSELIEEYKPRIYQYIKDLFISRIGSVIYYSTDNVILSVLKGSLLTGYLSNYTLITTQLNSVVVQILSSIQATFGNYINTNEDLPMQRKMTDNYFCANFIIGNFCFVCFSLLAQPFVKMVFGDRMLLSFSTVLWLGINLMLMFLIQLPSQVFTIYRLYRFDRPIIITSMSLNIVISIILAKRIGINGVLIGTFVTSLIYLFSRFFVISKYVFKVKYWYYVKKIGMYGVVSALTFFITYFATKNLIGDGIFRFGVRTIIVAMLSILTTAFFLSFTKEFDFLKNKLVPGKARKYLNKVTVGVCCTLVIVCSIIGGASRVDFQTSGNKSYARTDSYLVEENTGRNIFSLSFDDSILIFKDIAEKKPKSIFENETLKWYKELHDKYGVVISCYIFFEEDNFNLSQFPAVYRNEFIENSDWLRFGFHAVNGNVNYETGVIESDYIRTVAELERIVGKEAIDNVIRLHMFKGSYEEIKKLRYLDNEPIVGLLTSDDNRKSYYLDEGNNSYVYSHDEYYDSDLMLHFFSTDFRTEYVENINLKLKELSKDSYNNQRGDLVVFSHEWALSVENKEKIEKVCEYAKSKGYRFEFFEDVIR